ncbi:unnamed protein product [Polarella glacialis]|uniref:3'-5' exonuclease domain-containing protein n=1 Tax=Polarella glacialis TaxID=89957 RepID=A0A813G565_POLGL|nr:unnamed protein product [Polarella glacialis]|mmetsp:Transcript_41394/g.66874  ORF Transcript_41394/g.66874 Transcript_41394/m.66874 type:complete len:414 (+) Transcript_41394:119-1360(+)
MLRCKASYAEICPISAVKLVGNSLVAWPASLKNCRRAPHPLRETKPFLRDQILCRESGGHIGNVQNNMSIGEYKGKLVALFRATETVLDCGQGTIIDFPTWQALREMLSAKATEVQLTTRSLLRLAGEAEDEVAAGLADEVGSGVKAELPEPRRLSSSVPAQRQPAISGGGQKRGAPASAAAGQKPPQAKKIKAELKIEKGGGSKSGVRLGDWLQGPHPGEYPDAIRLVSSMDSESCRQLLEEAEAASFVAYDVQWSPDFDEGTDNPIALLQLAFASGITYVLQLPLLGGVPEQVQQLFESSSVLTVGFAANETDCHKLEVSGVPVDRASLVDVQPWCEAEMGENESVRQGWRVGLKRATSCVVDFEMDKTSTVAASNWERDELTTAQVEYAAMDVWVALRLYHRLAGVYGQA